MTASENLRRELESIEGRIGDLRETLHDAKETFRLVRGSAGWVRALEFRVLRVDLERRIRTLEQRRDMARTCLAEAERYEGWLGSIGRGKGREISVG